MVFAQRGRPGLGNHETAAEMLWPGYLPTFHECLAWAPAEISCAAGSGACAEQLRRWMRCRVRAGSTEHGQRWHARPCDGRDGRASSISTAAEAAQPGACLPPLDAGCAASPCRGATWEQQFRQPACAGSKFCGTQGARRVSGQRGG